MVNLFTIIYYKLTFQNFQRLHPLSLNQGFTLDSLGRAVCSISRPSVVLDTSTRMTFDQFVTSKNVRRPSTCYFDHCNISLTNKFCPNLTDKIPKEDKQGNHTQTFYKNCVTFLSTCFTLIVSLQKQGSKFYKNILLYTFECVLSCLNYHKNQ